MSPEPISTVILDRLALLSGQGRRLEIEVEPGEFELGGHLYVAEPDPVPGTIDVSRTLSGYALRLRLSVVVRGTCMRCLEAAAHGVEVDAREADQPGEPVDLDDEEAGLDGELASPYVVAGELDVARWARDALILALPEQIVCAEDCPGLCTVCGEPLRGAAPERHRHEEAGDPRWAKLRELK
ncbi:MAG TPA: YceD family protein [Solirubrobacterales bacterium]|nr:YceD family protein [Solirubrobacterales bacterium]